MVLGSSPIFMSVLMTSTFVRVKQVNRVVNTFERVGDGLGLFPHLYERLDDVHEPHTRHFAQHLYRHALYHRDLCGVS
jgi:hypothetical protein